MMDVGDAILRHLADEAQGQMHVFAIDPLGAGYPAGSQASRSFTAFGQGNGDEQANHERRPAIRWLAKLAPFQPGLSCLAAISKARRR